MSHYESSNIGKRSFPGKNRYNQDSSHGQPKDYHCKRRDKDTVHISSSMIDVAQVSGGDFDANDGKFSNFPEITDRTVEVLKDKGITSLFPIQTHCFYPMYQREDLIARDLTGSGKTFAFALPIVEYMRKNKLFKTGHVQAIMIAPTRELALQITAQINNLKHSADEFKVVTVYGGVSVSDQAYQLKRGVDLFVGTTGRVLDHIERGNIDFKGLKTVILDEADVMLKLGFKEDIEKIMEAVNAVREGEVQVALFSATVPSWVRDIAKNFMKPNFRVVDLAQDLSNKTAKNVKHLAIECPWSERLDALGRILSCYGTGKTIVFTSTKADANDLAVSDKIAHDVEVMHGDIAQNQREVTIKRFKEGKFQVLVATDVASRGLDIPCVDLIVQIEPPKDTESYIHRSGRTARAGKSGLCITLFNRNNEEFLIKAEELAGIRIERVHVPSDQDMIQSRHTDILRKMCDVEQEVLPQFKDAAIAMLEQNNGDPVVALQIALAYASGHYKQGIPTKSLLTGRDKVTTMKMNFIEEGRELSKDDAQDLLSKYWAPRIGGNVKTIRSTKDRSGVVFDIQAKDVEVFLESYENLRSNNSSRVDFNVNRCKLLPDLEGEGRHGGGSYGGRGGGDSDPNAGSRGGERPPMTCYNCQGVGHGARECTEPKKERNSGYGGGGRRDREEVDGRRPGGYDGGHKKRDYGNGGGSRHGESNGGGRNGGSNQSYDIMQPIEDDPPLYNNHPKKPKYNIYSPQGQDAGEGSAEGYEQDERYEGASTAYSNHSGKMKPNSGHPQDAYKARYNDNDAKPQGDFHHKQSQQEGSILYFTNLSYNTNEHDLMTFLKGQGFNPKRAKLLYDQQGKSKGTGFVQMDTQHEAKAAIQALQNQSLEGRHLVVNMATNQEY